MPIALLLLLGCGDKGEVTDDDNDGYSAEQDCDDAHPGIHPGATERCNGKDDDCDAAVDDGVLVAYWPDGDGDGYGRSEGSVEGCAAPGGYAEVDGDCDDADAAVHPGVEELCNGLDDDCDGEADPGAPEVAFTDADGDGYGDSTARTRTCVLADDQSWVGEDCDDTDPARRRSAGTTTTTTATACLTERTRPPSGTKTSTATATATTAPSSTPAIRRRGGCWRAATA
jgi:hypothetical protein